MRVEGGCPGFVVTVGNTKRGAGVRLPTVVPLRRSGKCWVLSARHAGGPGLATVRFRDGPPRGSSCV